MTRKAKATAALAAMQNLHKECLAKLLDSNDPNFNSSNLNGYAISSSEENKCKPSTNLISAIPDTNELPTYRYATDTGIITYNFKGITGTNFDKCLTFICDPTFNESKLINSALKSNLEENSFVIPDTYVERGCSAYVVVDGPTWEDA